mmetsp:Transcript_6440/g.13912  ORF Transcript_6440/g.13912 Transcript_6440/m.13912 type:complete len:91 (-) Transcript_6440:25-297(-)
MKLDYSCSNKVNITTVEYLEQALADFPEEIFGDATSPAGKNLFKIRSAPLLEEERKEALNHCVTQFLFVCMRCRPDIQTGISFLRTTGRN